MQSNRNFIDVNPNEQDMQEVLVWLKEEMDNYGSSFYHNRNVIEDALERNNLIVFNHNGKSIGMAVWYGYDAIQVNIDIFVIHPSYRKKGFGEFYYKEISDFFRSRNFKIAKLFCSPEESESFWIKMGFIEYPDCKTNDPLIYYQVLVDTASIVNDGEIEKIELWDVEPCSSEEINPRWTWYIRRYDGVLLNPVIQPCNYNWNVRWSKNGIVIKEAKVKYFTDGNFKVCCSNCLYIEELSE